MRLAETCRKVGLKQSAVYAYMANGKFPKSIKITAKAVGWLEHELDAWITARVKACRGGSVIQPPPENVKPAAPVGSRDDGRVSNNPVVNSGYSESNDSAQPVQTNGRRA